MGELGTVWIDELCVSKAPSVVSVVACGPFDGQLAMFMLIVRFSHETNRPPMARPSDILRTFEVSSAMLSRSEAVGIWNDSSTLIILMSNIPLTATGGELVVERNMDITVTFKQHGGLLALGTPQLILELST